MLSLDFGRVDTDGSIVFSQYQDLIIPLSWSYLNDTGKLKAVGYGHFTIAMEYIRGALHYAIGKQKRHGNHMPCSQTV